MDTLYTLKDRNQRYYAAQVPGGRTDCPDRADTLTLDKVREVMKRPAMAGSCWQMEPAARTKSTPAPLRPFDCFPTPRPEVQAGSAPAPVPAPPSDGAPSPSELPSRSAVPLSPALGRLASSLRAFLTQQKGQLEARRDQLRGRKDSLLQQAAANQLTGQALTQFYQQLQNTLLESAQAEQDLALAVELLSAPDDNQLLQSLQRAQKGGAA